MDFTNCPSATIVSETGIGLLHLKLARIMMGIILVIPLAMIRQIRLLKVNPSQNLDIFNLKICGCHSNR